MLKPNHLLLVSQLPSRPCPPVTLRLNSWILICNIFLSKGRCSPHCNTEAMIWRKKAANEISHTDILSVCCKDMQPHNQDEPIRFGAGAQLESRKRCSFSAAHFSPYLLSSTQSTSESRPDAWKSPSPDYIFFKAGSKKVAQIKHAVCPPGLWFFRDS